MRLQQIFPLYVLRTVFRAGRLQSARNVKYRAVRLTEHSRMYRCLRGLPCPVANTTMGNGREHSIYVRYVFVGMVDVCSEESCWKCRGRRCLCAYRMSRRTLTSLFPPSTRTFSCADNSPSYDEHRYRCCLSSVCSWLSRRRNPQEHVSASDRLQCACCRTVDTASIMRH